MCHCSICEPDTLMFCTLRGICVICQTSACKRLPQLCSSEIDSGTREKLQRGTKSRAAEFIDKGRSSCSALCCKSEYTSVLFGRSIGVSDVIF